MLFSSLLFLYAFLPLVLLLGWGGGRRMQNYVLLVFSLVFYAWSGVDYTLIILFSILFNYAFGWLIEKNRETPKARLWLAWCIAGNLLLLVIIKYTPFLYENLNAILKSTGAQPLNDPDIKLIPGISFFTFHAISYVTDIYRRDSIAQKNIATMGLYMVFFPQLIAGPIVRYHEIESQFAGRRITAEGVAEGIKRFIIGLTKKVIFSNTFAYPSDIIFKADIHAIDTPLAWFGIVCYSLHIYCDFSGYSDMALGLARMFGFTFPENFNFPYIARSVQDFWHRWHMTLSRWFRDYLYIPLGGNRKGPVRTYLNLILVFFLTGLWHGASWTMVAWGLFHGLFLILERAFLKNILPRLHVLNHVYTLVVVMIAWVFFKSTNIDFALAYIGRMFGTASTVEFGTAPAITYMNPEFTTVLVLALLFASGLFHKMIGWWNTNPQRLRVYSFFLPLKYLGTLVLLFICTVYLTRQGYNPFIYFQF